MENPQNQNMKLMIFAIAILGGTGIALFENFQKGVEINVLGFALIAMILFTALLIWLVRTKRLLPDNSMVKRTPAQALLVMVLIALVSFGFKYFLN